MRHTLALDLVPTHIYFNCLVLPRKLVETWTFISHYKNCEKYFKWMISSSLITVQSCYGLNSCRLGIPLPAFSSPVARKVPAPFTPRLPPPGLPPLHVNALNVQNRQPMNVNNINVTNVTNIKPKFRATENILQLHLICKMPKIMPHRKFALERSY